MKKPNSLEDFDVLPGGPTKKPAIGKVQKETRDDAEEVGVIES